MKKLLEDRGTNLISLVILVIVLLVVIAVLSVVIFGENGTRDNNKVKKYTEDLKQKLFEAKVNSLNNAGDLIEELATVIKNDGKKLTIAFKTVGVKTIIDDFVKFVE